MVKEHLDPFKIESENLNEKRSGKSNFHTWSIISNNDCSLKACDSARYDAIETSSILKMQTNYVNVLRIDQWHNVKSHETNASLWPLIRSAFKRSVLLQHELFGTAEHMN